MPVSRVAPPAEHGLLFEDIVQYFVVDLSLHLPIGQLAALVARATAETTFALKIAEQGVLVEHLKHAEPVQYFRTWLRRGCPVAVLGTKSRQIAQLQQHGWSAFTVPSSMDDTSVTALVTHTPAPRASLQSLVAEFRPL